jgi:hypothetical protein
MADTELRADSARDNRIPQSFDPADWLARLKTVGGWWVVIEGQIHIGWAIAGYTHEQNLEARRIYGEVKEEDKLAAVREYLLAHCVDHRA